MSDDHKFEQLDDTVTETVSPVSSYDYAGFWMRFWAYLLDLVVVFSLNSMLVKPIFRGFGISMQDVGFVSTFGLATGLVFYLYFILMTKFFGQTLGKMVFGLKVLPLQEKRLSWGTVIFREGVGRYISATFFFLYVVVAFTPKKQGIHDLFSDTTVVRDRTTRLQPA